MASADTFGEMANGPSGPSGPSSAIEPGVSETGVIRAELGPLGPLVPPSSKEWRETADYGTDQNHVGGADRGGESRTP